MKFCTNCGSPIREGEAHVCAQTAPQAHTENTSSELIRPIQAAPNPTLRAAQAELSKVEKTRLMELLKNPLSALQLRGETDLIYGLMGLAASLIGYMIWAWSFKRNIIHTLYGIMGISQSWDSAYAEANEQFAVLKPMFITGLASLAFLIIGAILFGRWLGQSKASWKEGLTALGGVQLVSCAGFLISALMLFVSLKIGMVLFIVVALSTMALTAYSAIQFFRISPNRVMQFIALFVLLQVVAVLLAMDFSATQALGEFKDSFLNELF